MSRPKGRAIDRESGRSRVAVCSHLTADGERVTRDRWAWIWGLLPLRVSALEYDPYPHFRCHSRHVTLMASFVADVCVTNLCGGCPWQAGRRQA